MTLPTQLVLTVFIEEPTREWYGLELCTVAGLASGTIHPILARLEQVGWVESRWEDVDPHDEGRPRRRYYRLSPDGAAPARVALRRAAAKGNAIGRLRPGWAGDAS